MNDQARCILAICRTPEDLEIIRGRDLDRPVIIATDDPEVATRGEALPGIARAVPLEGNPSISSVWERVERTTRQINTCLLAEQKQCHPAAVKWTASPASGATSGRIADLIMLIDRYKALIGREVETVMIVRRARTRWEDDLLVAVADHLYKEVVQIALPYYRFTRLMARDQVSLTLRGRTLTVPVPSRLRLFARRIGLMADVVRCVLTYPLVRRNDRARNVLLLLDSDDAAQVESTSLLQEEFEQRDDWEPLTLTWRVPGAYRALRNLGLAALRIESWFPLAGLGHTLREYRSARLLIHRALEHYRGDELTFQGIDLAPWLKPLVRDFADYELLERLVLLQALEKFLEANSTAIVRTTEGGLSPLGTICHFLLGEIELRSGEQRPFLFDVDTAPRERYLPVDTQRACDLLLVAGEHDRAMTEKRGGNADNMVVAGLPGQTGIERFAEQVHWADSTELVGVSRSPICNILFAPPRVRRGYYSAFELNHVADCLVAFAARHPEVNVLAQPRDDREHAWWRRLHARHGTPDNLHLLGAAVAPLHSLNLCDLLVTQVSALGFAALQLGKPLVAVALDGDRRSLECYGDAPLKYGDLVDLDAFLEYVCTEPEALGQWRDRALARQNRFLPRKLHQPDRPAASAIVNEVVKLLGHEMTLRKTIRRVPAQGQRAALRAARA